MIIIYYSNHKLNRLRVRAALKERSQLSDIRLVQILLPGQPRAEHRGALLLGHLDRLVRRVHLRPRTRMPRRAGRLRVRPLRMLRQPVMRSHLVSAARQHPLQPPPRHKHLL